MSRSHWKKQRTCLLTLGELIAVFAELDADNVKVGGAPTIEPIEGALCLSSVVEAELCCCRAENLSKLEGVSCCKGCEARCVLT